MKLSDLLFDQIKPLSSISQSINHREKMYILNLLFFFSFRLIFFEYYLLNLDFCRICRPAGDASRVRDRCE